MRHQGRLRSSMRRPNQRPALQSEPELPTRPPAPQPGPVVVVAAEAFRRRVTLESVLAPAVFRHPQAEREIRLGSHVVGFALRRARRRTIGFVVGVEGLSVSAPRWVGMREIEAALVEKGDWILKQAARAAGAGAPAARGARRLARRDHDSVPRRDGDRRPRPARQRGAGRCGSQHRRPGAARRGAADAARGAAARPPPRRRSAMRCRAGCSARRGASSRSAAASTPSASACATPVWPLVGADALGQRECERGDPAELAADPLRAADDRLRGRPRTGPPARDEPQPALLGCRALGAAGVRARAWRVAFGHPAGLRMMRMRRAFPPEVAGPAAVPSSPEPDRSVANATPASTLMKPGRS